MRHYIFKSLSFNKAGESISHDYHLINEKNDTAVDINDYAEVKDARDHANQPSGYYFYKNNDNYLLKCNPSLSDVMLTLASIFKEGNDNFNIYAKDALDRLDTIEEKTDLVTKFLSLKRNEEKIIECIFSFCEYYDIELATNKIYDVSAISDFLASQNLVHARLK